jgi:protocatechuate 3,4-dioxygenase beta subunit
MKLISRRRVVVRMLAGSGMALIGMPSIAAGGRLPRMTEGPFYPYAAYRARSVDWDADLTTVRGPAADGQPRPSAAGEHLDLHGPVVDGDGRLIDGAEVEIWQCDAYGSYRHPRGAGDRVDDGFQGFGAMKTAADGLYRFRTIRPVPYPGRTPHIHVKVRHPSFGEVTSQLFVVGDPGNAEDGLYRRLSAEDRSQTDFELRRPPGGATPTLAWVAERSLVVGR